MKRMLSFLLIGTSMGAVLLFFSFLGGLFTLGGRGSLGCLAATFVLIWVGFLVSRSMRALDAKLFGGATASPGDETAVRLFALVPWFVLPAFVLYVRITNEDPESNLGTALCILLSTVGLAAGLWEGPLLARWRQWRA